MSTKRQQEHDDNQALITKDARKLLRDASLLQYPLMANALIDYLIIAELEERLKKQTKELEWHRRHLLRLRWRAKRTGDYVDWDVLFFRQYVLEEGELERHPLRVQYLPLPGFPSPTSHGPSPAGWRAYLEQERRAR